MNFRRMASASSAACTGPRTVSSITTACAASVAGRGKREVAEIYALGKPGRAEVKVPGIELSLKYLTQLRDFIRAGVMKYAIRPARMFFKEGQPFAGGARPLSTVADENGGCFGQG
jgi:hypothetical protein